MKLFMPYLSAYLLGGLCGYFIALQFIPKEVRKKLTAEVVKGSESTLLKPGEVKVTKKLKPVTGSAAIKPDLLTKTDTLKFGDEDYTLAILITHKDSVTVDYFLGLTTKEIERIDTLEVTRVDTIKLKEVVEVEKPEPFYDNFWFGFSSAAALVLAAILLFN